VDAADTLRKEDIKWVLKSSLISGDEREADTLYHQSGPGR
jgi:hypothetical protein